jgi:3-deoxy-manno-octulosonate cytidylyltransferase (CMP-KDO synthetase)
VTAAPTFTVLIPARMASSRLPDKPLADIGRPADGGARGPACRAKRAPRTVVVAADDARIVAACARMACRPC